MILNRIVAHFQSNFSNSFTSFKKNPRKFYLRVNNLLFSTKTYKIILLFKMPFIDSYHKVYQLLITILYNLIPINKLLTKKLKNISEEYFEMLKFKG